MRITVTPEMLAEAKRADEMRSAMDAHHITIGMEIDFDEALARLGEMLLRAIAQAEREEDSPQ